MEAMYKLSIYLGGGKVCVVKWGVCIYTIEGGCEDSVIYM